MARKANNNYIINWKARAKSWNYVCYPLKDLGHWVQNVGLINIAHAFVFIF